MNKVKEIEIKIRELKEKNKKTLTPNNKINAKFYSIAMNISIELITGIWRRRCPSFSCLTLCFTYILPEICLPVHNLVHKTTMVLL